ncbi:MAG: TolB family protein, partial [Thermoguttaceae bacterium]
MLINGNTVLPANGTVAGVWFFHDRRLEDKSPQLLLLGFSTPSPKYRIVASLNPGDNVKIVTSANETLEFQAENEPKVFYTESTLALDPERSPWSLAPTECSPVFHPEIEQALIEHDWRLQDGIDTPLEPRTFSQAAEKMVPRIAALIDDLTDNGVELGTMKVQFDAIKNLNKFDEAQWLALHKLRREIVLKNPLLNTGPIVFAKNVPSTMSHQLTQVYGYTARPGGGIFVLDEPGVSMKNHPLTAGKLPQGSYMHPEVSHDGKKIYFAFCAADMSPSAWRDPDTMNRWYHIYELNSDGSGTLRKLTDGEFDDFNPTCLPDDSLLFVSTRRGGFHRCGGGPCFVYTLAKMNPGNGPKGENSLPYPISFHETNEWDPSILNDGRIIYTRWDYVDRDAVFYQQLWSTRQDGTNVRIFYGNNTFVPCGTWEARAIPGSGKVIATAAPHHGMSAGSLIMLDTTLGVDGEQPITRLTPDARFPEAETLLPASIPMPTPSDFDSQSPFNWDAVNRQDRPGARLTVPPEEELRWFGHCYKSPWPFSEKYFMASYSYDALKGEPGPNIPNMFGIYFVDSFGNKELIYRDPNISSVWAKP